MNPLSVDIKDLLESESLGIFGTNLFIGKEPISPTNCVTIYDTGGIEQNAKLALDESTIQIRARNTDYSSAFQALNLIKTSIEGKTSIEINGTQIVGIWTNSNITFVKHDTNDRAIFTVNFRVTREPALADTGNRQLIGGN